MSTITVSKSELEPTAPARLVILKAIFQEFVGLHQSLDGTYGIMAIHQPARAHEHAQRADVLMDLLEAHDCGSWGGFDKECTECGDLIFIERFIWLVKKYRNETDLGDKASGTSFKLLLDWFPPRKPILRVGEGLTKKKPKTCAAKG